MGAEGAEEIAGAGAGLEDPAGRTEVRDELPRELRRRLHDIVAGVITVGLKLHSNQKLKC